MIKEERIAANIRGLMGFLHGIPTYLLYVLILYTVLCSSRRSYFSTSFYKLFCLSAVNNITLHITSYLSLRAVGTPMFIPIFEALPESGFFITLIPVICYHCGVVINFIDFFISFSRITVILLKENYKEFWRRMMIWVYVAVLLAPNIFTWHFWFTDVKIKPYNDSDLEQGYYWEPYSEQNVPWMKNSRNMTIVIFGCGIPSFLMNSYVCFYLIKQKFFSRSDSVKRYSEKQNIQLLVYSCLIFITQMCLGLVQLAFTVATDKVLLDIAFSQVHYMLDIVALSPAWFLLIVDSALRQALFQAFVSKVMSNTSFSKAVTPCFMRSNSSVEHLMKY